jgi:60 kDa SS-A/Ro ribonucleoprotein
MMSSALKSVTTKASKTSTPQSEKAVKGQKKNHAGGYTFTVSPLDRAKRFLILGSEDSFYQSGKKLSKENAKNLIKLIESGHSTELVDLIVEVSTEGRAPKQDAGLFALAVASSHGTDAERTYAMSRLPEVARTATSLFVYVGYTQQFRGWGSGLRRAVAKWYLDKTVDSVAYQAVKYRQRDGYTHRDIFRLAHPQTADVALQGLGEWILRGNAENAPRIVKGFIEAQTAPVNKLPLLISEYGLSWEMLPTSALNEVKVWEALLDTKGSVPLGALIRQLPRLTRIGVIKSLGGKTSDIVARLTDKEELAKARIHPVNLLVSLKTYSQGYSTKGDSQWVPERRIIDALDKAFYLAFKTITPANKRTLIGLDVSGSMGWGDTGVEGLTPREVTAAISLVITATEPEVHTIGFTGGSRGGYYGGHSGYSSSNVTELKISPRMRLDTVVKNISGLPFGGTDCSLPMLYALEKGLEVDTFVIMTDNETWAGSMHPHEALAKYRKETGIDAKLVVFSTQATKFTIANPEDPGMLDIAGFDSAAPQIMTEFSRGL